MQFVSYHIDFDTICIIDQDINLIFEELNLNTTKSNIMLYNRFALLSALLGVASAVGYSGKPSSNSNSNINIDSIRIRRRAKSGKEEVKAAAVMNGILAPTIGIMEEIMITLAVSLEVLKQH